MLDTFHFMSEKPKGVCYFYNLVSQTLTAKMSQLEIRYITLGSTYLFFESTNVVTNHTLFQC